jgi:hypothetical protein
MSTYPVSKDRKLYRVWRTEQGVWPQHVKTFREARVAELFAAAAEMHGEKYAVRHLPIIRKRALRERLWGVEEVR